MDGVHRTGRMIFKKAFEMGIIKKDPTEFAYRKKDRKTIEELEEQGIPIYGKGRVKVTVANIRY